MATWTVSAGKPVVNMFHTRKRQSLSSALATLASDHSNIEAMSSVLEAAVARMAHGDYVDAQMIVGILRFFDEFVVRSHQRKEEQALFPLMRTADERAYALVERLLHEHSNQRELLEELSRSFRQLRSDPSISTHPFVVAARRRSGGAVRRKCRWRPRCAGACRLTFRGGTATPGFAAMRCERTSARPPRVARHWNGWRLRARAAASPTWLPMENSGLSEAMGSCRIMAMRLPRTRRISASDLSSRFSPSNIIRPLTMRAAGGSRRRMVSASVLLPEPEFADDAERSAGVQAERHVVHGAHYARALLGDIVGGKVFEREQRLR